MAAKNDTERFEADLIEFLANKDKYKFIQPRYENSSWIVRFQGKNISRGAKTLAEALTVRNELIEK